MSEDINISTLLQTLDSKVTSQEEKDAAYLQLANQLKEDSLSLVSLDVGKNSQKFCDFIKTDLEKNRADSNGLQILGFCLHDTEAVGNLSKEFCSQILSSLCQCIEKSEDKNVCAKSLWCLHQQSIGKDVVGQKVETMLSAVEHALLKWKMQSSVVEHEASQVIYRLLKDYRKEMDSLTLRWGKLLLPLMAHRATKIHEKALEVVKSELPSLLQHQRELVQALIPEFKLRISSEMKWFFTSQREMHALECWEIYVQICGKELHHGSFINMLLPIMELAFKGSNEVKIRAFQAWQVLIDNFATNYEILTCPKRCKLIMQVLKITNAKTEAVAMAKLQVWWHFVWLLGPKASANFEQVCLPLLQFCVGGLKNCNGFGTPRTHTNGPSPKTPRMNLSGSGVGSSYPRIPSLQLKGCEVLAHFLGSVPEDLDVPKFSFSLDQLTHDLISGPGFFVKQAPVFIQCTADLICELGSQIPDELLLHIWYSLIAHMRNGLDSGSRSEMKDAFTLFLTQFQVIVLSQALPVKIILKLFNAVGCLPSKALISTAYNVNCGEKLHGTPALFLVQLLLTPNLIKDCASMESYSALYGKLVNIGIGGPGSLEFAQAVLHLLDVSEVFVDSPDWLWRLWSTVVNPLHEFILKTNEVNQGDALEHDFSCLYAALLFPIKHQLPEKLAQMSVKTLQKTWSEIYQTFARLSALVTNAQANICCEDLCHQIHKHLKELDLPSFSMIDFLIQASQAVISSFDFSSLCSVGAFGIHSISVSPAKWTKKKHKPMENLQSYVVLLRQLMEALNTYIKQADKEASNSVSPQGPASGIIECLSNLFTHISSSGVLSAVIGHLSQPIGDLYQESIKKTCAKLFNNNFMQKLEKLWNEICSALQTKYSGTYDSDLLSKLSPLLEATFLHPRRAIKNQTALLWSATFSKTSHLIYPETLRPVLSKVREKSSVLLPGWVSVPVTVVEETPVSQMSQADSQAPEPHLPGMPSPRKIHGSFLNKAVSPNVKKSPSRPTEKVTRSPGATKKNLSINDLQKEDFVVIKSPPKKKRVLTEHQKEVLKEKRVIPTMYNTLDNSQDVSIMFGSDSHFGSDTQSQPPTPAADSLIIINSSFSQNLSQKKDKPVTVRASRRSSSEASDREDSQNAKREPGTGRRRRSVRFKDTQEEEPQKSDEANQGENKLIKAQEEESRLTGAQEGENELTPRDKSEGAGDEISGHDEFEAVWDQALSKMVDEVEKNSIEHFVVIKDTISSSQEQRQSSGESMPNSTESERSTPSSGSKSSGSMDSTPSEEAEMESLKNPSSEEKETETLKKSSSSSGEVFVAPANVMEAVDMDFLTYKSTSSSNKSAGDDGSKNEEKGDSQSLLTRTSQLKSTKQLSPGKVKSPLKKISIESSPARSSRRFASPAKRGRSKALENSSKGSQKLDEWLIKSPEKLSQESGISSQGSMKSSGSSSNASQPAEVTVVEETQSPKSLKSRVSPNSEPIQETPPPPTSKDPVKFGNTKGSTRKLFTKATEADSNLDISEDSNIIPASPESKTGSLPLRVGTPVLKLKRLTEDEIKHFSPRKGDVGFGTQKGDGVSEGSSSLEKSSQDVNHEHDDFSDVLPLEEVPLSSSQGFETQGNAKSIDGQAEVKMTSTENLFTQKEDTQESLGYNPQSQSTFKSNCEGKDVLGTENLKLSQQSNQAETSVEGQSQEAKAMESGQVYDPKLESTLAQDTPRRGRKRKQDTPKKLSPESSRPKRTRQSKGEDVKTPKGKSETGSKRGRPKEGKVEEKKGKNNTSAVAKSNGKQMTSSQQNTEEDSLVKEASQVSSQEPGSENMIANDERVVDNKEDTERENSAVGYERQFDSEGFFLEDTQRKDVEKQAPKKEEKKKTEISEVITAEEKGEKTPTSRNSAEIPVRKSTTKKKIEVAKKRSQKKGKSTTKDKSISDSSEDDVPLSQTAKKAVKSKGNLENKMNEVTEKKESEEKLDEKSEEVAKNSESSDDNVPLNEICSSNAEEMEVDASEDVLTDSKKDISGGNVEKEEKDIRSDQKGKESISEGKDESKSKRIGKKKFAPAKTSPLSNRLRSSHGTLRSGKPTRRSLSPRQSPKSLSMKKTVKRKSLDPSLLTTVIEDSEEPVGKPAKEVDRNENSLLLGDEESLKEKGNTGGEQKETSQEKQNETSQDKQNEASKDNVDIQSESKKVTFDETPTKVPENGTEDGGFAMFERNTDSKLVVVPRKFEKRAVARRSILKPPSPGSHLSKGSPLRKAAPFHPIKLGQIFAPSASPSASILKRRRLSGDFPANSPSPPCKKKQRRVSFADPVTCTGTPLSEAAASPTPSTVSICSNPDPSSKSCLFSNTSSAAQANEEVSQTQESQVPSTLGSYASVSESQLTMEPVYPELVDCSQTVDRVLPQLTTSMWSRGLGQLVKARNIHTIGDLSRLSEKEIDNLPIKSPKVPTVRKVLRTFVSHQESRKPTIKPTKADDSNEKTGDKSSVTVAENNPGRGDEMEVLPSMEEDLGRLSPIKKSANEDLNRSIADEMGSTEDLLEKENQWGSEEGESSIGFIPSSSITLEPVEEQALSETKGSVTEDLDKMSGLLSMESLSSLRTNELFEAHQKLLSMANTVATAMKRRCCSPDKS